MKTRRISLVAAALALSAAVTCSPRIKLLLAELHHPLAALRPLPAAPDT